MGKMENFLKLNRTFIICLSGMVVFYCFYIFRVSYNIPFMDYWRLTLRTIQMTDQGESLFRLAWMDDWGQRNPLLYLCLWINLKFFQLDCRLSEYMAVIPLSLSSILIYRRWLCAIEADSKPIIRRWHGIFIIAALFNLNQWEILSIQFAFVFMVRIFFYIYIFYILDILTHEESAKKRKKYLIVSAVTAIIVICTMSQLYFISMVFTAWFTLLLNLVLSRGNENHMTLKEYMLWIMSSIFGILVYFFGIHMPANGGGDKYIFNKNPQWRIAMWNIKNVWFNYYTSAIYRFIRIFSHIFDRKYYFLSCFV